jgi:hypothetical protein
LADEIHKLVEEPITSQDSSPEDDSSSISPSHSIEGNNHSTGQLKAPQVVDDDDFSERLVPTTHNNNNANAYLMSMEESTLRNIIRDAVEEALNGSVQSEVPLRRSDRKQPHVDAKRLVSSASSIASLTNGAGDRLNLLASRLDMLENVLGAGAEDRHSELVDIDARFSALEQRVEMMEYRLEEALSERSNAAALTVQQNGKEVDAGALVVETARRLSELEQAVETEHEFSLKLLDIMLNSQQQQHSSKEMSIIPQQTLAVLDVPVSTAAVAGGNLNKSSGGGVSSSSANQRENKTAQGSRSNKGSSKGPSFRQ